jgi:hypothetical protein
MRTGMYHFTFLEKLSRSNTRAEGEWLNDCREERVYHLPVQRSTKRFVMNVGVHFEGSYLDVAI